jgi:hypothetical protein
MSAAPGDPPSTRSCHSRRPPAPWIGAALWISCAALSVDALEGSSRRVMPPQVAPTSYALQIVDPAPSPPVEREPMRPIDPEAPLPGEQSLSRPGGSGGAPRPRADGLRLAAAAASDPQPARPTAGKPPAIGSPAPDIPLFDQNGQESSLRQALKDRFVVLVFYIGYT